MSAGYRISSVEDILAAIARIERYLAGIDESAFATDTLRQDAVTRCLEVISEASRRIPDAFKNGHPDIPWKEIAGIGNILRHEYQKVSSTIIWKIASGRMAELKKAATSIHEAMTLRSASHAKDPPEG